MSTITINPPVTLPLSVTEGGSGVATLTDGGILFGNGTGVIQASAGLAIGKSPVGVASGTDPVIIPTPTLGKPFNMGLVSATTTNSGDSIKITSADGTALSSTNPLIVAVPSTSAGQVTYLQATSDVTILLTGAHWGIGGTGDISNGILRVYAINDNGTLKWGIGYQGGFTYIRSSQDNTTPTNIDLPEEILSNSDISTDNSPCVEVGYFYANFDDTGGAAEDLWAVQTGAAVLPRVGQTADGIWQAWNPSFSGFSANPTVTYAKWMQKGKTITLRSRKNANGASNATTFTFTAPIKTTTDVFASASFRAVDNGSNTNTPSLCQGTGTASTTISLFKNTNGDGWTNTNGKGSDLDLVYEAYQP